MNLSEKWKIGFSINTWVVWIPCWLCSKTTQAQNKTKNKKIQNKKLKPKKHSPIFPIQQITHTIFCNNTNGLHWNFFIKRLNFLHNCFLFASNCWNLYFHWCIHACASGGSPHESVVPSLETQPSHYPIFITNSYVLSEGWILESFFFLLNLWKIIIWSGICCM